MNPTDMTVYFVDDDELSRQAVKRLLRKIVKLHVFSSGQALLDGIDRQVPDVLITDMHMPEMDGMALIAAARKRDRELPIIVLSGMGQVATVVQALKAGAYDYVDKPTLSTLLPETVKRACERRRLSAENRRLRNQLVDSADSSRLTGISPAIKRLREIIAGIAEADASVLLRGETGSGKEVVARELHRLSERRDGPFVAINCGAVPESIFDSEMFGHEAGAFTGAAKRRIGKIEHASGGTLFLDEVDSMPLAMQVKLLRVLQERKLERLGTNSLLDVDLRIIAASQKDLAQESQTGAFRQDLFFRLNVIPLQLPSLRERPDDIPLLFAHFYRLAAERFRRKVQEPTAEVVAWLMAQPWPGNVRELQNAAERAVLVGFDRLTEGSLAPSQPGSEKPVVEASLPEMIAAYEKQLIEQELRRQKGSVDATYKALQIPRKTLYGKFKKYGVKRADFIQAKESPL